MTALWRLHVGTFGFVRARACVFMVFGSVHGLFVVLLMAVLGFSAF